MDTGVEIRAGEGSLVDEWDEEIFFEVLEASTSEEVLGVEFFDEILEDDSGRRVSAEDGEPLTISK